MNKEIEELLNKIKNAIKKHKEEDLQDDMLVILELDVIQWQLLLSYIEQLENNRDKAIKYLEKSKLNQLDTYCKYLHINFSTDKIENIDESIDILKGDSDE